MGALEVLIFCDVVVAGCHKWFLWLLIQNIAKALGAILKA